VSSFFAALSSFEFATTSGLSLKIRITSLRRK